MPAPTTASVDNPRAMGYGVALGTALFRPAYGPGRELQIQTAPLEAPSLDTRTNPEELNEEFGRTFARDDFTGGEGLDFAHSRAERRAKDSRYFDSKNIALSRANPGELRDIRLLHGTERIFTSANTMRMAWDGTTLYVSDGTTVRSCTDPTVAVPTFSADDPHAGEGAATVAHLAYLGSTIYAALNGNGIHRKTSGGAWAHWSDIPAARLWSVKSRILATVDTTGSLYEAVAGAAPTPLYTLPAGKTWNDVIDAGDAILAASSDGNIYAFAPDATTAVLRLIAQTPIEGEQPMALGYAQGIVFYATAEQDASGVIARLWRAELSEGLALVNGQLIRQFPAVSGVTRIIREITATRDSVYVGIPESATESHLWRYDLVTGGLFRSLVNTGTGGGQVHSILTIAGMTFMGVSGYGVTRETSTYAASGWLIGPLGDFFSSAVKSWVGARLDTANVTNVKTVSLYYSTDPEAILDEAHASWTLVATQDAAGEMTTDEYALSGVESRWIAGKVVLTTTGAGTPTVRSFGFRAVPGGGGGSANVDKVVQVPVNVSDQLERANKRRVRVKGWGRQVYASLRQFEGEALTMTLYLPGETIALRGLVESVGAPVQVSAERGSATAYAMVKFRGREVAA
jgi:hypothetical protein